MQQLHRYTLLITLFVWGTLLPFLVLAAGDCNGETCLENPLKFPSVERAIEGLLQAVVIIALPIITVFVVWAGFLFISARGNPGGLETAKRNFQYVIIGAILILSAWVLATLIGGTVTQLLG